MRLISFGKIVALVLIVSTLSYAKNLQKRSQTAVQPLFLDSATMMNLATVSGLSCKMSLFYALGFEMITKANLEFKVNNYELILYDHMMYSSNDAYRNMLHSEYQDLPPPFLDPLAPAASNILEGNTGN